MQVITNHHWRQFKYRNEVPDNVLSEYFEHLDEDEDGFFSYRGHWYHLSDFMRFDDHAPFDSKWDGYCSDSFFSGVLLKYGDDCETYQVALYLS